MAASRSLTAALGAVALVAACSGDLFHSTKWASLCDEEPGTCGGGSTVGPTSSSSGHATASSSGAGAGGSGGSGVGGAGGGGGPSGSSSAASSSSTGAGAGGPTCDNGEVQEPTTLHCYAFVAAPVSWSAALSDCQSRGGVLASVTSASEDAFLAAHEGATSWLGGTDVANEGTWIWISGDAFSYTNWNVGEPNNSGGAENCLAQNGPVSGAPGTWNDAGCDTPLAYVCERVP